MLLAPVVPHITEELWEKLGHKGKLSDCPWPGYDPAVASEEEITIVVQVNGKLRGRLVVPAEESDDRIKKWALQDEKIGKFLEGKQPLKVIYVPRKLVNIVVRS
jgi:leucyl-tRNA synthetase